MATSAYLTAAGSAGFYGLLNQFVQKYLKGDPAFASYAVSTVHALVATSLSVRGLWMLRHKLHSAPVRGGKERSMYDARLLFSWGNQNPYYQNVLASTFGYLAQDILYVFSVPVLLSKATLFHHSLGFYGIGLIIKHKMGAGLAMHFLLNEMSTPFVNNLYFISKSKKAVPTWLQAGNGICLMAFFFTARVLMNGKLFLRTLKELRRQEAIARAKRTNESVSEDSSSSGSADKAVNMWMLRTICYFSGVLGALNSYWFLLMLRGFSQKFIQNKRSK